MFISLASCPYLLNKICPCPANYFGRYVGSVNTTRDFKHWRWGWKQRKSLGDEQKSLFAFSLLTKAKLSKPYAPFCSLLGASFNGKCAPILSKSQRTKQSRNSGSPSSYNYDCGQAAAKLTPI